MAVHRSNFSLSDVQETCKNCKLSSICLPNGLVSNQIDKLDQIVRRIPSIETKKHLYQSGEPFDSLYIVRSGCIKEYACTSSGDEQILGFKFAGEIIGIDSIDSGQYVSSAFPLVTSSVCKIAYSKFDQICDVTPGLAKQILNIISREIAAKHDFRIALTHKSAEQRLALFISSVSTRLKLLGYSDREFNLPMTRADIGNYLGLTFETVSRTLSIFVQDRIIKVNLKNVQINDMEKLQILAGHCSTCPTTIAKAS